MNNIVTLTPGDTTKMKPQCALIVLNENFRKVKTLRVPFDAVRLHRPLMYRGTMYVHYASHLVPDAMHDDPNIDWRAHVHYEATHQPLILADDTPEAK